MKKYISLFALVSLLLTGYLSATEPEPTCAEGESAPAIPKFEPGDKVYLSITGNVPRMVVYLSAVENDEFKNPEKYDYSKGEFLIPYDEKVDVRIWTRSGTRRDVVRVNAKTLLDSITEEMKKCPGDTKNWEWQEKEEEFTINFKFAGIQRFFRLESITVPTSSQLRNRPEYQGGHSPMLHIFIDIDGVLKTDIPTRKKGWIVSFPPDRTSQFELREWANETITLRLKDRNTWTTRRGLREIGGIKFSDIRSGTILENIDVYDNKNSAVVLEFREVK